MGAPKGEKAKQVAIKKKYKVAKSGSDKHDVKEEVKEEKDVKKELKEKPKVKKKAKSKSTKLKNEKPVIKEEPLVREESVLSNKTVIKGRRKADKSETKTGENGLGKTAQLEVPVKRVRRK